VLANREIPAEHLRSPLDQLDPPPGLDLAPGGARSDFWKSIDGVLKPGLEIQVSLVVDVGVLTPTAPVPGELDVTTTDRRNPSTRSRRHAVVEEGTGRLVPPGDPYVEVE
jgi:hypothetical protein